MEHREETLARYRRKAERNKEARTRLVAWFESQFTPEMSWNNYGSYWHIDHITPCARFDLGDPETCFHYSNLRPLPAIENLTRKKK